MRKIVSKNIRIRNKKFFQVGIGSIIDDFSYFSTKVKVGNFTHFAANCHVGGGQKYKFEIGDYCSISSGVKIWCESNNYIEDLPIVHKDLNKINNNPVSGNVRIKNFCIVGSNSVIMPNNIIPEGVAIGALSYVPQNFKFNSWSVYAGTPIKFIKKREKRKIISKYKQFKKYYVK
jgi:acetyltransferase-like isoleucine patch superfamily enzyme